MLQKLHIGKKEIELSWLKYNNCIFVGNCISEGLSSYICHHENNGLIHDAHICWGNPSITHLLIVDDSFLFCKATVSEVTTLKNILDTYENTSHQAIKYQKSSIAFSRNTNSSLRSNIIHLLGAVEFMEHGKHLGLPSTVGWDKKSIFSFIKECIWKNI